MMRVALALMMAVGLSACIPPGAARSDYDAPPAPAPRAAPEDQPHQSPPPEQDVRVLPAPPQAWDARRVSADARPVSASIYSVQPGDTLRGIADKTGAGSEAIARANGIVPPHVIFPGQRLTIPGGRYHLVRAGESGIAIARAYGIDWSRIVTANALAEPYILRTGQRLLIPSSSSSPSQSREERAAAFHIDIDDILTGGQPALASAAKPAKPSTSPKRVLPATAAVVAPPRLTGQFTWPVRGQVVKRFGTGASGERNDGIKIAVPRATPVLAAADGVVAYVGSDVPALGGLVILRHGNGWTSVYGHASQLLVQRGQSVKKGQKIALSGSTGFADRPELHFEIRKGRTPVDPTSQLPAR